MEENERVRCCECGRAIKYVKNEYYKENGDGPYCRLCMLKERGDS